MKKEIIILLIFSLLSVTGCDFLRKVASRPTSEDLKHKSELIAAREKAVQDSIFAVQEAIRARQAAEQDSLASLSALSAAGLKVSTVFSFGQPQNPVPGRFSVITGVYRKEATARKQFNAQRSAGYTPTYIVFKDGIRAVCLISTDSAQEAASVAASARKLPGVCPKDAWVFVKW